MEEKYSLKVIQNGQTTLARQVRSGAGANGQALVVKAQDAAATDQLVNPVTLTSPAKLQFKRKGDDLQVSLPGGDSDMPDLVIQNYFAVEGNAVKGVSQNGEWMSYDTSVFVPKAVVPGDKPVKALNPDSPAAVALGEAPLSALVKFDSPLGLAAIGGGALALGTMGKGGGSGGGGPGTPTPTNNTDALSVIKSYAGAATGTAEPTSAQYTAAGVTLPTVDGVSAANVLTALNRVVSGKQAVDVASKAQLQALADALKSSWALIIAEANGSTADATPDSAPTATDYLNVGVTVGSTTKALALMNSALGQLSIASVNTAAGVKDLATAADNVMKVAAGTSGASISNTDLLKLGLKINGANSGITSEQATAFTKNLANLKTSLGTSDTLNTGDAVNTYDELQALFSLQVLRSYNDDTATTKTQPAPGVADYTNTGVKAYASLSDTADASRVALDYTKFGLSSDSALAATLNSALDNQAGSTGLTKAVVQTMVDAYYKVLKEAGSTTSNTGTYVNIDSQSNPNPSLANYISIGITKSDANKTALADATDVSLKTLLNDAIGRLPVSAVDTAREIQELEKAAENILTQGIVTDSSKAYETSYTSDSEWLSGFSALGVTGVTSSNLSGIKSAIDSEVTGTDVSAIDTVKEIQAIVSLYRINDYAAEDTINPLPTLADYQGILANKNINFLTNGLSANLSAYNDAVRTKPVVADHKTFADDSKVSDLVKSFDTILKFADGSSSTYVNTAPVKSDFVNVGVGNGLSLALKTAVTTMLDTSEYTNLLADVIGGKNASQVNTISQLNDLASIIERISELEAKTTSNAANYSSITGGSLSVADFDALKLETNDLKTVSGSKLQDRLNYIYDNLVQVDHTLAASRQLFDTVIELNALIKASATNFPA